MAVKRKIPREDHVLRYAGKNQLETAENDDGSVTVIGIQRDAFRRKEDEKTLSVTWVEFFSGDSRERIDKAAQVFRNTFNSAAKKPFRGAFAIGEIARIHSVCDNHGHQVRVVHDPKPGNEGHAGITRLPRDNDDLLDALAYSAFAEFVLNKEIPEQIVLEVEMVEQDLPANSAQEEPSN